MAYAYILYFFAYYLYVCSNSTLDVAAIIFLIAPVMWLMYVDLNHTIIKRFVGNKTVVIFETLLIFTLIAISMCYGIIWNLPKVA